MNIKTLLLLLFLYVCLAWVGAELLRPDDVVHYGLLWTAIGLIVVLAFVIGARLFGWWRLWRARAAARPVAAARAVPTAALSEDEIALTALLREANASLVESPSYAGQPAATPLVGKPLYLLIGPEGTGKTSTFVNSGLEPQLLAGQVSGTGPALPTRLSNIWVANDVIFVELGGRAFSGDPARWTQLLKVLKGDSAAPTWRRFWRQPEQGMWLRGVIAFCDAKEFTGTPSTQGLDRRSRDMQDRLQAVGEVFGVDFPVYQVFTKCDAIPYFPDFFRFLPEMEASQVFGCTLPVNGGAAEASADEKAKQLTRTFRPLYQEIAKRRITQLAHEPDQARRPAVYEFPRELKRIRTPLLQFLSDTFRPHPLRVGPRLRGYYLTGVREVEVAGAALTETRADWGPQKMEATRLFSAADATRMFRPSDVAAAPKAGPGGVLVRRWIFTTDLFRNVILADKSMRRARPVDHQGALMRNAVFAGVCGLCLLLCFAFMWSWIRNRSLLVDVQGVAQAGIEQPGKSLVDKLSALDSLRDRLQRLIAWGHSTPLGLSWGLYAGDRVLDQARQAYFQHFQNLLLTPLNGAMVTHMRNLPANPPEGEQEGPVEQLLRAHLMITGGCSPVDSAVVGKVLMDQRNEIHLAGGSTQEQDLADKQIDFYARELPQESQWKLKPDVEGIQQARIYLQNSKGVDRLYRTIIANVESKLSKLKPLGQYASNYPRVMRGPDLPSTAYTPDGWRAFEKAAKAGSVGGSGDPCVMGASASSSGDRSADAGTAKKLKARYFAEYIAQWRNFVRGSSVLSYSGADDAATKLQILADYKSPLLALFFVTGTETNLPVAPDESPIQKAASGLPFFKDLKVKKKKAEEEARKTGYMQSETKEMGPSDVTRVFQPVQWVVPVTSDNWVGEKNTAYVEALQGLGNAMRAIAANRTDQAAQQAAQQNYDKALGTAKQIELGFRSVGDDGVDLAVQSLLEQPILHARGLINTDVTVVAAGQANAELRKLCAELGPMLRKYPFQQTPKDDVSLEELQKFFGPTSPIWQFQQKTLAELTVKEGSQWKAKDPSKKPQVTEEMLTFLNRAQAIADAFYPGGAAASLTYNLRPKLDPNLKDWKITLLIDGQASEWTPTMSLQKSFHWPAPTPKDQGAVGRLAISGFSTPFASRGGLWGVFRFMADAEPRPAGGKTVEWKYMHSGDGRPEPLQPPVTLEFASFPIGGDVFNPRFFSLQCPTKAVQ